MNACNIIDKELAKILMPERLDDSNKGTFGKVLNFSGSKEYTGAAYLSSVAALRVGAGYVELATPNFVREKVASLCADIVFADVESYSYIESLPKNKEIESYSAVIVGCGLSNNKFTQKFLKKFINEVKDSKIPVIYDADALNIIAHDGITELGGSAVLTPHPGELARLMGTEVSDIQGARDDYARMAAQKYHSVIILKGHNTVIACPDGKYFKDITGTSVLAKAGMGDVLTGIIAGLCSQGLNTRQASVLGVYLHSQAGVCAEKIKTQYGLLASELLDFIPEGIKSVIL